MTTNRVVADDTVKGSRFYRILSKIMAILTQIRQDEYPYDPEDLDKHLQEAHDGIFTGQWAHPLHFILNADEKELHDEFRKMRSELPNHLVAKIREAEPVASYRDRHFSVITDFYALMMEGDKTGPPSTLPNIDSVLQRWNLQQAGVWDLWAISRLRLGQRSMTILAAGDRRKNALVAGQADGWLLPGFNLQDRDFLEVTIRPENVFDQSRGRFGLLVEHKNDPWNLRV